MEVTEWYAPAHSAVKKGSVEEVMSLGGGVREGGHRQGIQRLWAPPGDGDLHPIPGTGVIGGGKRIASSGQ